MSGGNFILILEVVLFLSAIWFAGRICRIIKISPLIGEIAVGLILGPQSLGIVPAVEAKEHGEFESLWQVLGVLGVTLMIAESGTHIHFNKLKKVGLAAVGVAIVGTFLPLGSGIALAMAFGAGFIPAFAAGCAMAPTSVGIALKLLTEAKQLNSLPGQTIVAAAFLDDVFSIILLVVLKGFKGGTASSSTMDIVNIVLRFIYCFLFLGIGVVLALSLFATYLPKLLKCIPSSEKLNYQPRDEMHLLLMIAVLVGYSYIGDLIGSHLLGAFIAGISFSQVSRSMYVWRRQLKRLSSWLVRFFFACTVAFTIPATSLMSFDAFWKGCVFALGPGIICKLLAGYASYKHRYVVGFAMVGRGEFAYLVAQSAKSWDIISAELYAIIVWALLLAVIVAPLAFRKVLQRSFAHQTKSGVKYFTIQAEGEHHTGIHFEIVDVLHNLRLDVLEAKVETDGDVDMSEFIVGIADGDLDEDKIHEILHDIREAVGEDAAQVQVVPVDKMDIQSLIRKRNTRKNKKGANKYSKLHASSTSLSNISNSNHDGNNNSNGGGGGGGSGHSKSYFDLLSRKIPSCRFYFGGGGGDSKQSKSCGNLGLGHVNSNSRSATEMASIQYGLKNRHQSNSNAQQSVDSPGENVSAGELENEDGAANINNNLRSFDTSPSKSAVVANHTKSGTNTEEQQHDSSSSFSLNSNTNTTDKVGASSMIRRHSNHSNNSNHNLIHNDNTNLGVISYDSTNSHIANYIEVKLMSGHSTNIFADMVTILHEFGITLVKGYMEDFLDTDSEVIFGRINNQHVLDNLDIAQLKLALKNVFVQLGIKGQVMVKRVRKDSVRLPHHMKFSELLKTSLPSNPLLGMSHSNSGSKSGSGSQNKNGYEIDISCDNFGSCYILAAISNRFQKLFLDIRSIHVQDDYRNQTLISCFFVQECNAFLFSPHARRKVIEAELTNLFQSEQIAAKIKTKAIEMGKGFIESPMLTRQPSLNNGKNGVVDVVDIFHKTLPNINSELVNDNTTESNMNNNNNNSCESSADSLGIMQTNNNNSNNNSNNTASFNSSAHSVPVVSFNGGLTVETDTSSMNDSSNRSYHHKNALNVHSNTVDMLIVTPNHHHSLSGKRGSAAAVAAALQSTTATITQSVTIVTPKLKSKKLPFASPLQRSTITKNLKDVFSALDGSTHNHMNLNHTPAQKVNIANAQKHLMPDPLMNIISGGGGGGSSMIMNHNTNSTPATIDEELEIGSVTRAPISFNLITLLNDNTIVQRKSCTTVPTLDLLPLPQHPQSPTNDSNSNQQQHTDDNNDDDENIIIDMSMNMQDSIIIADDDDAGSSKGSIIHNRDLLKHVVIDVSSPAPAPAPAAATVARDQS